jgi:hypothetical protein
VRFPDEVAALLLLDPAHEGYNAYMPQELTKMWEGWSKKQLGRLMNLAIAGAFRFALGRSLLLRVPVIKHYRKLYRALFAQEMADWPEGIREVLIERHVSLEWLLTGLHESKNVEELYDEIRHAGPMPDVPLIVLCSMGTDGFKEAVSAGVSSHCCAINDGSGVSTRRWSNQSPWRDPLIDGDTSPCTSAIEGGEAIQDLLGRATTAGW